MIPLPLIDLGVEAIIEAVKDAKRRTAKLPARCCPASYPVITTTRPFIPAPSCGRQT